MYISTSELWAWKAFTDPNPDFSMISHCSVFNVKPSLPTFKVAVSLNLAAALSLSGGRQCGAAQLSPFAGCCVLLICLWVLAT